MVRGIRFLVLVALFFSLGASEAFAATWYANSSTGNDTTGDGTSGNPYKTFHKAYTEATAGDTIDLAGTFDWSSADETGDSSSTGYTLAKDIVIRGQGATSTIIQAATASTTGDRRVFTIDATASTTIQDLTIRHGRLTSGSSDGGGMLNNGTTTLERAHVRENYAQVSSSGTGGGISNKGTLTLRDSAILYNHAISQGGGLNNSHTGTQGSRPTVMYVVNTTIAYNTQSASSATVGGSGIFAREGTVYVLNSSIVENNHLSSNNSYTPAVSTGGGTVHLKNTIVANNKKQGTYLRDVSGAYEVSGITDGGNNIISLISSTSGLNTNTWYDQAGSGLGDNVYRKVGSASPTGGLFLDDVLQSGGYLRIGGTSIAVNNSTTTALSTLDVPSTDQAIQARSGLADIGAYEFYAANNAAPATTGSELIAGTVADRNMNLSWTNGDGERRLVFVKEDATSGQAAPVDNTTYTASTTFRGGDQIGSSGWYAVYKGRGSSVAISGLDYAKNYRVHVVEYNGIETEEKYLTTSGANNPITRSAYAGTTLYANSSTGNDSTGTGSSGSPYKTFNKAYTASLDGDTIHLNGTFTWTDTDETGDAVSSGYTISRFNFTIRGQSATSTIIQAATASTTGDRSVFTIASIASTTLQDLTVRHGRLTSGASSDGGGILNNGTTTLERVHVRDNYVQVSTSGQGGGISNKGTLTLRDSAILYNHTYSQGGGLNNSHTGTQSARPTSATLINTTIAYNTQTSSSATVGGSGIFAREGTVYVLNSSIVENNHLSSNNSYTPAVSTGGGTVHLKNTIVANNKKQGTYLRDVSGAYDVSGITDAGNNIISKVPSTSGLNTNTWYDQAGSGAGDDVYRKVGSASPTGGLNLNSTFDTDIGAFTLLADSIAINNATTTALVTIEVPTADQSRTARDVTPDIGAMEYISDPTPPTVVLTLPDNGVTIRGSAIGITADASDNIAVAGVKFYVNNVLVGAEDTSAPYGIVWNSLTATTSGTKTVIAVARDSANNYATSTARTVTLANQPAPSGVAASANTSAATVTWATPVEGSSKMFFGFTNGLASSTPEANTSSRVTSHSVNLSGLRPCAVYKYYTVSKNESNEIATSSLSTFKTAGCSGGATITANNEDDITVASGGTLTQDVLTLTIPASFTASSSQASFQAKKLDGSTFFSNVTGPSGKSRAGTTVYNLSAYTDTSTALSTFEEPVTVTLAYSDSDVSGLDATSLKIHRYDGAAWSELSGCTVNTGAKTVTCTTTSFSDFAIFGDEAETEAESEAVVAADVSSTSKRYSVSIVDRVEALKRMGNFAEAAALVARWSHLSVFSNVSAQVSQQPVLLVRGSFERTLRAGETHADVKRLQQFLNTHGFTIASTGAGAPGNETEYFGTRTQLALKRYQEANATAILKPIGLTKGTGLFGPGTRAFLNTQISTPEARLAEDLD